METIISMGNFLVIPIKHNIILKKMNRANQRRMLQKKYPTLLNQLRSILITITNTTNNVLGER
jgi:hypothetical protein